MKNFLIASVVFSPSLLMSQIAQSIDWGTTAAGQTLVTSDGSAISLPDFSIELGSFAPGFTPTSTNTADWVMNWQVFDAVTAGDIDSDDTFGPSPFGGGDRFSGEAELLLGQFSNSEDADPADMFTGQAYVFVRNDDDTTSADTEWLLYTNSDWNYPTLDENHTNFPVNWLLDADTTAVVGEVSENGFVTQSVPEPSSSLLLLLGGLSLLRRRR